MVWQLIEDEKELSNLTSLSQTCQNNYKTWAERIRDGGMHPREAANKSHHYKLFHNSKIIQGQIYLDSDQRVTFLIHKSTNTVEVLQIGGHT
ncbi:hypothetical protein FE392_15070 [Xenorhabdus sp. 12]|uniref:Uncharacterized protein n=1 Tax=Xenorhabdus santafensis TaxID=2582833 RepID=A0ABU4SD41_9GAMM|nr:hypothetical protein [Xenorhabdus sp. 12]MDX7988636.1 hypothetical protein [Xenorhabdus sp. 12]